MVLSKNIKETPSSNADIICPDAVSVCPVDTTCCISTDGEYSCCPQVDGVCCSDRIHCCPAHYQCDLKIFKCDRSFARKEMLSVQPSSKKS